MTELAYLNWLAGEEKARQKNIVLARRYFDGDHDVPLTERQKEFLGFSDSGRFAVNYCGKVVGAVVERLLVAGFKSVDAEMAAMAWQWWQANRMDEVQGTVHEGAVRDGEFFVMVDWDGALGWPRIISHPRYTDPQVKGTGFGCKAFYPNDDPSQPMERASKRWTETVIDDRGQRQTRQRMTDYYPDRVEKYVLATRGGSQAGWEEYAEEDGGVWPLAWKDQAGRPLGIPVVHFRNSGLKTELWDAIPVQDAVNKTALDILAAADACGFRVLVAKGFIPTRDGKPPENDGSNYLQIAPGSWIAVPKDAEVDPLEAADLGPMLEALDSWIVKLGLVTDTPVSRFRVTRQVAAENTLKQQEEPLLAKVRRRQTSFGNSWENVMYLGRRLANTFGGAGLDEGVLVETQWEPAETRDEKERIETIGLKVEQLRIPLEVAWAEAGYSQDQIEEMKGTDEYQARAAMREMAKVGLGAMGGEDEG
jgi:hypothetical protein